MAQPAFHLDGALVILHQGMRGGEAQAVILHRAFRGEEGIENLRLQRRGNARPVVPDKQMQHRLACGQAVILRQLRRDAFHARVHRDARQPPLVGDRHERLARVEQEVEQDLVDLSRVA